METGGMVNADGRAPASVDRGSPAPAPVGPRRLSEEIRGLICAFAEHPVSLRDAMEVLRGRAFTLLLFLLALPFCTPIPLPGLSSPFGLVIALIGFRLSLGQKPWLPDRLLNTQLPPRFFAKLLAGTQRLVRGLEYLLRPRLSFLVDRKILHHGYGLIILICGLLLLLPLPIPFSNGLPALTVVLLAAAILERDGYCVVAGLAMFFITLCFFGVIFWSGAEVADWLRDRFGNIADPD